MANYQRSRWINAQPETVYRFVSDIHNLTTYVPTVQSAEMVGDDRIRVKGEFQGNRFSDTGWFKLDPDRQRIEWSSGEHDYSGWMPVTPGTNSGTQVVVDLTLPPWVTASGRPITGEPDGHDLPERSLEDALDSLRNMIEGSGGKEVPAEVLSPETGPTP
jgi:uncharacterized membrane protein